MITLCKLFMDGKKELEQAGIQEFDLDAWYLLEHCFQINKTQYILNRGKVVSEQKVDQYKKLISLRSNRIPLQQITRQQEFMGFVFEVNEHVLIPRQDTEILVEEVLKVSEHKSVLDLCTGSGCIIISLCKLSNLLSATGVDVSDQALEVAKRNGVRNDTDINWIKSDLLKQLPKTEKYDIIVSNPPYIETKLISELMPEVRLHEPILALDGKEDGLFFYREIIKDARYYLKDGGSIFFEIGYNQGKAVSDLLIDAGYNNIHIKKDLSKLDRVVYGTLRS